MKKKSAGVRLDNHRRENLNETPAVLSPEEIKKKTETKQINY
ncbi:hypothetical protein [Riemerella columbina]|nr:hypothetical protein [Riemerella columbina]